MNNQNNRFKLLSLSRYSRYLKIIFTKNVLIIIIISSIISNSIVLIQNKRYDNIYKSLEGQDIEIKGKVVEDLNEKYKVKITSKKYKDLFIYLKCKDKLQYGNEIIIYGKYEVFNKARNYKGFNYRNYLKTLKIIGTVKAQKVEVLRKNSINIFLSKINKLNLYLSKKIDGFKLKKEEKTILKGILLGDKSEIEEETITNFSESNISHILAISGMHIAYIIMMISFVINKIIGKHFSKVVTSIFVFLYMCLTRFPVTLVRAGVSGIVLIMSNFFYRKNDIWQSLSLSLIIILIYNPFLILNIGLQLSYSAIIGIVLFQKVLKKHVNNKLEKTNNKAIRKNKRKTKYIIRIINSRIGTIILDSFILTISCTLAIIPIAIYHFNSMALFSIILSMLASFIIAPIIILGLVCLIFDFTFIENLLSFCLKILVFISKLGSRIPLNKIYMVTPNIIFIILYYFITFLSIFIIKISLEKNPSLFHMRIKNLISLSKYRFNQNKTKVVSIVLIICIVSSIYIIIPKNLKIYFVDVGQRRLHSYCNSK